MGYLTLDQIETQFGHDRIVDLTDRATPPTGEIDTALVAGVIASVEALIDGHIAGRYLLPLTGDHKALTDAALAIAYYKLHVYEPDPKVVRDHKDALAALRDIASGTLRLVGETGASLPGSSASGAQISDRVRPFSSDSLKGFI